MYPARPWTAQYEPGVPFSLPPADTPFHAALEAAAATSPGYPALRFFGASMSFAELNALADRVASGLVGGGLRPGDKVLIVLPQCPYLMACCLGVLKAGGIAAPISPDVSEAEVERAARNIEPTFVFATPGTSELLLGVLPFGEATIVTVRASSSLPRLVRAIARVSRSQREPRRRSLEGAAEWDDWLKSSRTAPEVGVAPESPALVLMSPGQADPMLYSHAHLVSGAAQLRAWLTDAMPGEDTWLQLAPPWTGLGFVLGMGTAMVIRAQAVLLPCWDVEDVLDALRYLRPGFIVASRSATERVSADPRLARVDLRSVRAWLTDEPMPPASARTFEEMSGISVCQGYAPPGAAGMAICNPLNGRREVGSLGVPLPGVIAQMVGPTGKPAPEGQVGRLTLSGPNLAAEGWLDTGLRARMDDAGFVYPVGG